MGSTTTIQELLAAIVSQHNDASPEQYDRLSITFSTNWDGSVCTDGFRLSDIGDAVAAYYGDHVCPVKDVSLALEEYDHRSGSCRIRVDLKFSRTPGTRYVAYPFLPVTEQSEIKYYC
jgi:hypothetical protein